MARLAKRLLMITAWTLTGVAVIWTGAYFALNDARLGDLISSRVNKVERGRFILERAHYSWGGGLISLLTNVPTRVQGDAYTLRDPDGNLVLKVPHVEADVRIQSLIVSLAKMAVMHRFYLDLHFTHAWVDDGFAVITPTRSTWGHELSEVNIVAAMSPRHPTPPDGGEFRITVEALELGHIDFGIGFANREGRASWYGTVEDAHGHASLHYSSDTAKETAAGPYFFFKVGQLAAARGALQLGPDYHFPLEGLQGAEFGSADGKREELAFRAVASSLGAGVRVSGALTDAYSLTPGVRLQLDFEHGLGPAHLLPPPVRDWLAGDPAGTLHINGPFTGVVIEGDVHGARADLGLIALDGASTHLKLAGDAVLHLDPLVGRTAGGTLTSRIEIGLVDKGWWRARFDLRNLDPARIPALPRTLAPWVAGRLTGSLRAGGSLVDHPERITVRDIDAQLERSGAGHLPKHISTGGGLTWSPTHVELADLRVAAGVGPGALAVTATGGVDPRDGALDATVHVDGADAAPTLRSFGLPAGLRVGALHGEGHVGGRWPRPTVDLQAKVAHVGYADRTLEQVQAALHFAAGRLRVDGLHGEGLGGTVAGDAELGLFADGDVGRPLPALTLRGRFTAHGLSVRALTGATVLDGGADLDLSVDGPLARPHGQGTLAIDSLTLYGDRYRQGHAAFALGDGGIDFHDVSIRRAGGGSLTGAGHLGWDLDYDVQLAPTAFPIAAIPNVASLPFTLAGTLSGQLRITGDPDGWMPGGDIHLTGFYLRSTRLGDGELHLEPGGDASRVRGTFFDKLVSVEGNLTPFPKLTGALTVKFADVALESIFPEMRELLVDFTGKASGEAAVKFNLESGVSVVLSLSKIVLTLADTEEDGHLRRLDIYNTSPVVITFNGDHLEVRPTKLHSAQGDVQLEAREISAHRVDAKVNGQIPLELVEYFFRNAFDHTDGDAFVNLTVKGEPSRPLLSGRIDLRRVVLQPRGLEHRMAVNAGSVTFDETGVRLEDLTVNMDGAIAHASGSVALDGWKPGAISGQVDGELSAKVLQWLFSDKLVDAAGRVAINVRLEGQWSLPKWQGSAQLHNLRLQIRRFAHEIALAQGSVNFVDYRVLLGCPRGLEGCQAITGTLDGQSPIQLDGELTFGQDLQPRKVDLSFRGTEIQQSSRVYVVTVSPTLRLTSPDGISFKLAGSLALVEGRYLQQFDILKDLVVRPRAVEIEEPFWQGDPRLETMELAVHAQSTGPLHISVGIANLTFSTALDISGTLSDPRMAGTMQLEENGSFNIGQRGPLTSEPGRIYFDPSKRIPDDTPTFDVSATGVCTDQRDNQHSVTVKLAGTVRNPVLSFTSLEGWDMGSIILCLYAGRTPDELRKLGQTDPNVARGGVSTTEGFSKTVSGAVLGEVLSDPVRKAIGFDTTSIEIGPGSVDVKLCKRYGRFIKWCGAGEIGFLGSSKVQGEVQVRLSDYFSMLLKIEYLTQTIDTLEEAPTRLKLELFNVRIPLGN